MKLIYDPSVYLVGVPSLRDAEVERFLDADCPNRQWVLGAHGATSDAETIPEVAGRTCYMSFDKPRPGGNKAYLEHILEVGHGSVLEHSAFNFIFTGVSRSFTHELVRHRAGFSYSQLSQRYVDESVAEFVVPHDLAGEVRAAEAYMRGKTAEVVDKLSPVPQTMASFNCLDQVDIALNRITNCVWDHPGEPCMMGLCWVRSVLRDNKAYREQVTYLSQRIRRADYAGFLSHPANAGTEEGDWWASRPQEYRTGVRKAARQAARSLLPNATETKIFASANVRALRHFIEMRASRHAEPEIRKLAVAVLQTLQQEALHLFGDYEVRPLADGTFEAITKYRKV